MFNFQGNPVVTHCKFIENSAHGGSGMRNEQSSPTVTNCTFSGNLSSGNGGGMANDNNSNPTVTNCTFINNIGYFGAGMRNWKSSPTITNCKFIGNTAESGGGMFNSEGSSPIVMNCTFSGNSALGPHNFGGQGGGILNYYYCSPTFTNSTFSSNSANCGGGIYSWFYNTLKVTNCTFTGNSAGLYGGGIYNDSNSTLTNCTFTGNSVGLDGGGMYNYYGTSMVNNCILWGNYAHNHGPQVAIGLSYEQYTVNISYSSVQGGQAQVYDPCEVIVWEAGNIDADPCFADLGCWDPNGTPADANDDFFVTGDYHLKSEGGRYDPTTQSWIYDDVTSPCIDAGNPIFPIGLEPFPNGGIINMGAYGGTTEASKSYFGKPPCETIVAGDVNGDCVVNFLDFRLMALHWCEDNNP
jgi:predicted outer membrane repeat protein